MVKPGETAATDKRLTDQECRKLQHEIKTFMVQYFKRILGRGVDNIKIFLFEDMLLIRLEGFLTDPEKFIVNTPDGVDMIRTTRRQVAKQQVIDNLAYLEEKLDAKALYQTYDLDPEHDFASHLIVFDRMMTE